MEHRNNVAVKTRPQQVAVIEEDETDEPGIGPAPAPEPVSKYEAVRQALQAGVVKPQKIAEWIKAHHGYELTPGHCSSYKSKIGAESQPKQPKPTRNSFHGNGESFVKADPVLAAAAGRDQIQDLKSLAGMVRAHGLDKVQDMLETIQLVAGSSR